MGGLFGGGGQSSKSYNKNWDWAKDTYRPMGETGVGGFNALAGLLGVGGSAASKQALDNYWDSSGGQFLLDKGLDDVTHRFSSLGLSRSGSAMKAMEGYRQNLASTKLDNYLGQLSNLAGLGLQAGQVVNQAGQYSKTKGGGGGLGSLIGTALAFI